jgi:SpoVK/Ycf46/Vps4 family AAA+-type ATPase
MKPATRCAAPGRQSRSSGRNPCRRCSKKSACWSTAAAPSNSSPRAAPWARSAARRLKKWLTERRKLFQMRDTLSAEIVPKGLLMMGIPGCGKSLSVKAIASCFELPLYRIDMIEIFSGRHGKPEGAFVGLPMLEDMAPAVLWFDEIEMGITSTESSGEQGRIFAFFLTWMQEKSRGLFVAATANRIDLLPAEMIRKGRFDEVFFVDLPLDDERIEIFKIHLSRRGVDPARFNLAQLTQFTIGWTGAEIEQCVVSAMTKARWRTARSARTI